MEKIIIYEQEAEYRDDFRIRGYRFGRGDKAVAVVGSMRGNEHQQLFAASQLVKRLIQIEAAGHLNEDRQILVIPCANPYSMNIRKRFWTIDNTDINRMFPGYSEGETTQRIAAGIFDAVRDFETGIQFASFYMRGSFAPHIRIMRTGFEDVEKAKQFGLPYVILRNPRPFDTTTLNYNWQIWETDAFSLYTTDTERVNRKSAEQAVGAILHYMVLEGLVDSEEDHFTPAPKQQLVMDDDLLTVRAQDAGFFQSNVHPGDTVERGTVLAKIEDAYEGRILSPVLSPSDGTILFMHDEDMCYADSAIFKIMKK